MYHGAFKIGLIVFLLMLAQFCQSQSLPNDFCLSNEEKQLFNQINQLRQSYGKPDLQLSASLSFVAKTHVNDLLTHRPDTSICNLSSWSNQGSWTECCFNAYVPQPDCMWDKPKELTPYPYRGYEFVTYFDDEVSIDSVMNLFSDTKEVLDMILTQEVYNNKKWLCCGVGMNKHYVSVWFGQRKDALPDPQICNGDTVALIKSTAAQSLSVYYLIFGSYTDLHDAREALKKIKKDDFSESGILNKKGQIRVYLEKYTTLKEAMYAKQQLAPAYKEAWILKD